jgi:hypothetical protein
MLKQSERSVAGEKEECMIRQRSKLTFFGDIGESKPLGYGKD